jgi:hypothetical protein
MARAQMELNLNQNSKLPFFRASKNAWDGTDMVALTCMRRECGKPTYVRREDLDPEQATAACFHCFRVSRIPS